MRKIVFLFILSVTSIVCYGQGAVGNTDTGNKSCVKIDGWYYNLNSQDKTAEVTNGARENEQVYISLTSATIPNVVRYNGNAYRVTGIGNMAFAGCSNLRSVTLPEGITQIGLYAFAACSSLQSVYIPQSVRMIMPGAFHYCGSVRSFVVDAANENYCSVDGVLFTKFKGAPSWLLYYPAAKQGTEYIVPDGSLAIMHAAFASSQLKKITIPSSVFSISEEAFVDCRQLESLICYAPTPPTCDKNMFGELPQKVPRIYVPKESIELYKAATGWGEQYVYIPMADSRK